MERKSNQKKWVALVDEQLHSGLSQEKWCAENEISIHAFRYWKKKFTIESNERQKIDDGFVELKPAVLPSEVLNVRIGVAVIEIEASANLTLLGEVVQVLKKHA